MRNFSVFFFFNHRWQGPISVGVYSPGSDYAAAVDAILFYRQCGPGSSLVRDLASFHLIFDADHTPEKVFSQQELSDRKVPLTFPRR